MKFAETSPDKLAQVELSRDPALHTRRLELREIVESDFDGHARLFSNPEVVRFSYDDQVTPDELNRHTSRGAWGR